MAYDEKLAERVRTLISGAPGVVEKKMFGGVGFILHGNMACGIHKDSLVVRIGPEKYADVVMQPQIRPFDITGRPMKGWILVDQAGVIEDADLQHWVEQGLSFAGTLPPK
ncbi:MAG: TfoX/Sxy family protein [Anaerolineales bacterium]|nr:TfoX/Sxy family protein [Anaerolineales bacterium]